MHHFRLVNLTKQLMFVVIIFYDKILQTQANGRFDFNFGWY